MLSRNKSGGGGSFVPLPEWIHRALGCATNDGDLEVVSSDAYIIPALRIALSLAEQIYQAEEESSNNLQVILPTPDSNWSSKVVVQLDDDDDAKKPSPVGQLGKNEDNNPDSRLLNDIIDHEICPENYVHGGGDVDRDGNTSYLAVTCAQLLSTEAGADNRDNTPQEKLRRIHSLGLVFYEVFSGGDRPLLHGNEVCSELDGNFDPLPMGELNNDEMNLADALKIFDDLDEGLHEPQKKAVLSRHPAISSEQLKMKNIPGPLCDLVANMIDCISIEFSDSEAYRSMSDVLVDLQLMMDKPAIFLRGIDLNKISSSEIHFSDSLFGRERELSVVTTAHQRSLLSLGEKELLVITGPAGSGKSYLSQRFGHYVTASRGLFLSAKFDQLKQARPLSALASVFNDYCETLLIGVGGEKRAASLASELRSRLSGDVIYLTKIIPSLVNILGRNTCVSLDEDNNCTDAQQRLQFLLCHFVEAITISSSAPITVHLDDLHNADDASIGVINELIFTFKSTQKIFFLVSSREDEKLWKLLANLSHFEVPHIQIKMDNLDELAINKTLSELLQISPRLTRPLSSIAHHKTRGNALFFSHWIMSLSREGLLHPSLSRRRWVWDEDEIRRAKLPDDVAMFFRNAIYKLPGDVQKALNVMACFGASLDGALTNSLERALLMQLVMPLNVAVNEGLLDKINDQYRFCHDCVQEAAYNMITPEEKCLHHFQHGLSLAKLYLSEVPLGQDNDDILFAAVNQLNLGGPAALEALEESFTVSTLNLTAGKKAMGMSDFKAAYSFFDNGISFLRKKHWQQHYGLSLELFCLAAKCALATGDFVSLKLLSEQVLKNANTFEEKIPVIYCSVCALTCSGQMLEGAEQIILILSQLGEPLPEQTSSSTMLRIVSQTVDRLENYSISELKKLERMNDPIKKITMLFLKTLHFCFFNINPDMQPIVTTKMIQLTLSHGMCETSPLAFALFGSMLGKLGNVKKGYHYTNLAKQLVEENIFYESTGIVIASAAQLSCYVEPVQAVLPFFLEACERSMSAGDAATACVSILYYCNEAYIAGEALPTLKEKCSEARQLMKRLSHFSALSHLVTIERHLQSLMGASWEGLHHGEEEEAEETNPHNIFFSIVYSMSNNFMFRRYNASKSIVQRFLALNRVDWTLMFGQSDVTYIFGLTAFWINRVSKEQSWKKAGVRAKEAMKGWTNSSKWNFEHKLFLLDAEENFCAGNFDESKILYDKAIKSAKEHRFVNGEALACELAGYFYLELGEKNNAKDYFVMAHERYVTWGALGKAAALYQKIAREDSISISLK